MNKRLSLLSLGLIIPAALLLSACSHRTYRSVPKSAGETTPAVISSPQPSSSPASSTSPQTEDPVIKAEFDNSLKVMDEATAPDKSDALSSPGLSDQDLGI